VHVKISAFMRLSAGPFPAADLAPALRALAAAFGAQRLLWGSDFPYALLGAPMPPGAAAPPSGADGLVSYKAVASALEGQWKHGLSSEELGWLLGGTAQRLFWRGNGS
jgi:predicted TIM-barrel fold metal-dependent hydrolase